MDPEKAEGAIQLKSVSHLDHKTDKEPNDKVNKPDYPPPYVNNAYTADNEGKTDEAKTIETEFAADVDVLKNNGLGSKQFDDGQYEESSDEEDDVQCRGICGRVISGRNAIVAYAENNGSVVKGIVWSLIGILYLAYFITVCVKYFNSDDEGDIRLVWLTCLVAFFIVLYFINSHCFKNVNIFDNDSWESEKSTRMRNVGYWVLIVVVSLFIVGFVIADVAIQRPENLISGLGMIVFVLVFYIFSYNPGKVNFRPVFWGLALQFMFALVILRTHWGYSAFRWLGERVGEFLAHTDAGSSFVFGDTLVFGNENISFFSVFAFKVVTIVIFFSSIISILYHWGVMQFVIRVIARFLAFCLGTSPTESLNAAGNIFIGQSESPLMIRPFLKDMTKSELHAVCTGGFATIAGSVLGAYIAMGIPANHLLSASVMSAPAALAMAKLFWPETKKSKSNATEVYNMEKGKEHNFIEAASNGASVAISLIANIAVNLIAFIAILEFINKTLTWFGQRLDMDQEITFSWICSYVFIPIAWLMGVTGEREVRTVARLVGVKTFLNEFVAYDELSGIIVNTAVYNEYTSNVTGEYNGTVYKGDDIYLNNGTLLVGGILTDRATVIATYALCGFSNIASIGIMIGSLSAMAPTRRKDITKVVVRAMIAGNFACFMTACISGLLYQGPK